MGGVASPVGLRVEIVLTASKDGADFVGSPGATKAREGPETARVGSETPAAWSVVVVARNAAHLLTNCLRSVPAGVPIWVVDHRSFDGTAQVAAAAGARVVAGRGPLGALRTQGLAQVESPWALFLDADERLTPEAGRQVDRALQGASPTQGGFLLGFHTWLGGTRLRTGGWGLTWHLRLVRVAGARCDPTARVHERLEAAGTVSRLGRLVDHHSFENLAHAGRKLRRYALQGARARAEAAAPVGGGWRRRAREAGWRVDAAFRTAWRWLRRAVVLGAVLQPRSALALAGRDAGSVWLKHRRCARLRGRREARERAATQV